MSKFEISDIVKEKAFKSLIQELEQEIKNKPVEIEELEIEYIKFSFLNKVEKEDYDEELKELMAKIKQERKITAKLRAKIDNLKSNFEGKIVIKN
ncbi:hypothetical protein [Clostridium vincentii]|uniref:Uncharacterized protein n=1 Tax=Clostridium vincentii TaxID=52704 RepID=A0A2T0BHL4_9CLOT|nr:hypothetical protein [Clostridium vincentii]PRR83358.1 hypothetical protein CLVI_09050 [Clostridium vincentii]